MSAKLLKAAVTGALSLSVLFTASAVTIGISPAEDPSFGESGRSTPMPFLVSGCMNRLFDAGFIVSDAAVMPATRSQWETISVDTTALHDAFVDFDIRLYVEWKESSFKAGILLPSRIGYRLLRIADGKTILEGYVEGPPDSEDAALHHEEEAAKAGAAGIASCVEALTTLAKGDRL
jgi:hypothetical protein